MLCYLVSTYASESFLLTWFFTTFLGLFFVLSLSLIVFLPLYPFITFNRWQYKHNPRLPSAEDVRGEIIACLRSFPFATLCPATSIYLTQKGFSRAYCGWGPDGQDYGLQWAVLSALIVWIGSDFYEFYYHRLGHVTSLGWSQHRSHHRFPNPSPFAVISDDVVDQVMRSAPLLVLPLVFPINMDILFLTYSLFFYAYGVYLHCGFEADWILDAHNKYINSSFQHYIHHAKSTPTHFCTTGFFLKIWDRLFGSECEDCERVRTNPEVYQRKCKCCKCCRGRGERSEQAYAKLSRPSYSPLLRPSFWAAKHWMRLQV